MEKTKLLTIGIIGLLLLNIGILGFLFLNHPREGRRENRPMRAKEIIIHKLDLDAGQQKQYEKLIQWHRGKIDSLDGAIRNSKNRLYLQLVRTQPDTNAVESLTTDIANTQKEIERTH